MMAGYGRVLRTGLSRLRRLAAARLAPPGVNPSRLEFRPDSRGEFDELVARFDDGGVFIETMNDQSVYVDFTWDDGRHCQLWISCGGRSKLRYHHEHDQGDPPRYTALGVDRMPWLPDYSAQATSAGTAEPRSGSGRQPASAVPKGCAQ